MCVLGGDPQHVTVNVINQRLYMYMLIVRPQKNRHIRWWCPVLFVQWSTTRICRFLLDRLQDLVLDTLSIYTIRLLSADMVDKAGVVLQVEGWRWVLVSTKVKVNDGSRPFKLAFQALILMISYHPKRPKRPFCGFGHVCLCRWLWSSLRKSALAFLSSLNLWL